MKKIVIIFSGLIFSFTLIAANSYPVIPFPNKLVEKEGHFELKSSLSVSLPWAFRTELIGLTEIFANEYRIDLLPSKNGKLQFKQNSQLAYEAYTLSVSDGKIKVEASSATGCFWAIQTIRQLMTLTGKGSYTIANCEIYDQPAYPWRAYLLDEGVYFKGKEVVKMLLDEMALLKLNIFHWHLTNDFGWRVEIKKYPLLTEIGAWRDSSQLITWGSSTYDPHPHGGYYTQSDIKEIVEYASIRHITIVPQITMPGHVSAAIAAYPWLGASGKPIKVPCTFGVKNDVLNVANEKVYGFIEDVLKEVMTLFPGKVIHMGGDEVRYDQWKSNASINMLLKKQEFKNYSDVHVYFANRISKFLENNGRHLMGWNEILGKNVHEWSKEANTTQSLSKNSIIHFWKGDPALVNDAIERGYQVVNSYHLFTYLDYNYKKISLEKAYNFSPTPKEIKGEAAKNILGLGCQMWQEWTPNVVDVHRQTFPRIAAYAEVGWTNETNKNYDRFLKSLDNHKRHWDSKGIFYYRDSK